MLRPQKKLSHPSRDRRAICVSTADPHMCSHPIKNRSTCHCAPRPFHGFARGIGQSFSCSMDVLVVSALPSVVALVVHVLHVDDGLFACSGSIAVDTLRTEQRNVDRRAKRISVATRSSEVRVRKIFHVVCAFSWYMIMSTRNLPPARSITQPREASVPRDSQHMVLEWSLTLRASPVRERGTLIWWCR